MAEFEQKRRPAPEREQDEIVEIRKGACQDFCVSRSLLVQM